MSDSDTDDDDDDGDLDAHGGDGTTEPRKQCPSGRKLAAASNPIAHAAALVPARMYAPATTSSHLPCPSPLLVPQGPAGGPTDHTTPAVVAAHPVLPFALVAFRDGTAAILHT